MMLARQPGAPAAPNLMQGATQELDKAAQSIQEAAQGAIPQRLREPEWGGVSLLDIGLALGIIVCAILVRWLVMFLLDVSLGRLLRRRAGEFAQRVFDGLLRILGFAMLLAGLFLAFSMLDLPSKPVDWAGGIWRFYNSLLIVFAGMLCYRVIDATLRFWRHPRTERDTGVLRQELVPLARDMLKVLFVILALILIVQSWGYSATALLAGVGIGGLALAFAAQDTVANVFGSLVIYTDRPFRTGDWVQIGGVEGVVEEIGIRSTRIRKFDKTVVSVPNKQVTSENIQNYSAMHMRRVKLILNLSYSSTPEQLAQTLAAIRALISGDERLFQDNWAVNLDDFGALGVSLLIYCFTYTTTWQEFLTVREELMLAVLRTLAENGVEIATPLQVRAGPGAPTVPGGPS